jgi:hypothetical protein
MNARRGIDGAGDAGMKIVARRRNRLSMLVGKPGFVALKILKL